MRQNSLAAVPKEWDRSGLPGWTYTSAELLELESELLFRSHWQLICHVADVAEPGDFVTLDVCGERALVVRGRDGVVRAFHNLCRHRGSRLVAEERGNVRGLLICPFHGWTYNLDGCLRGVAHPKSLPPLDPVEWGLKPLETEIWHGFVFVRFKPGPQPSVAEVMGRHEAEIAPYDVAAMTATHSIDWGEESPVNWKAVRDVDNEGYHVAMAHPGLHELYGRYYLDEAFHKGSSRSFATFNPGEGRIWSVRAYKSILPEVPSLPETHRRAWLYLAMFPNTVIALYPDSVLFYQEFPLAVDRTLIRGAVYARPDEDRALRAARYLSGRIDKLTAEEDKQLTIWSCEATQSSAYDGVLLTDLEYGVKTYHDHLRALMPVMNLDDSPEPGTLADVNTQMLAGKA
ncbi:MAG: aromatic ring-hydroxylating dioxygenase subunit alpha [Rhodobiaceae bacterium]|nr:aromatic ring-hydroxylating dioxygenase subunit alpha [Rhodobiaceae bacterium]MCC0053172.1 aromatic ring-hydroxylating dioxygenase subunit alpha [Rhodobiaceae bacterium]